MRYEDEDTQGTEASQLALLAAAALLCVVAMVALVQLFAFAPGADDTWSRSATSREAPAAAVRDNGHGDPYATAYETWASGGGGHGERAVATGCPGAFEGDDLVAALQGGLIWQTLRHQRGPCRQAP
ncbi:MAG: hypothetical protein H6733_04885 [Alphaproteobacteria bacterium]|nr:hypothetical protein [Alphaproteobacteria bacterium]